MAKLPPPLNTIASLIDKHHEDRQEPPRPHLGGSIIGHKCNRYLWLNFRWAVQEEFKGRILRLFRRGHHEENWIVSDLKAIGIDVQEFDPSTGEQYRFSDGHFSGSLDGIALSGVPEAPEKKHVLEFKTHALKSFTDLQKNGVEKSKPTHYAQMQVYMLSQDIDRALYVAVCKNDDEIYTERVRLNKTIAKELNIKAQDIIASDRMPEPMTYDATFFECKWCPAFELCHEKKPTKHVNCRTCAHSTAERDGTWSCARWNTTIPSVEAQRAGCDDHVIHPDLVPSWVLKGGNATSAIYEIDGKEITVGNGGLKSKDLLHPVEAVASIVKEFEGKVL